MENTNIAKYVQKKYSIWKEISENINWIQCHTFVGHLELLCNKYSRKEKKVILWSRTYETRIVETEIQMVYFTIMSIFVLLKIAIIEFEFIEILWISCISPKRKKTKKQNKQTNKKYIEKYRY